MNSTTGQKRDATVTHEDEQRVTRSLIDAELAEHYGLPSDTQLSLDILPGNTVLRFLARVLPVLLGEQDAEYLIRSLRRGLERRRRRSLERQVRLQEQRVAREHAKMEREKERERMWRQRVLELQIREEEKKRRQEEARAKEQTARRHAEEERRKMEEERTKARAERWQRIVGFFRQRKEQWEAWRKEMALQREKAREEQTRIAEEKNRQREEKRRKREEKRAAKEEEQKRRAEERKNAEEEMRRKREGERAARAQARKAYWSRLFSRAKTPATPSSAPLDETRLNDGGQERIVEEAKKEAMRQILIEREKDRLRQAQAAPTLQAVGPSVDAAAMERARAELSAEKTYIERERQTLQEQRERLERERAAVMITKAGKSAEKTAQTGEISAAEKERIRSEAFAEAKALFAEETARAPQHALEAERAKGAETQQSIALKEELAKWKKQMGKVEQERRELEQRRALQEEQERARKEERRLEEQRMELERQRIARERAALEEDQMHKIRLAETKEQLVEEEKELQEEKKKVSAAPPPPEVVKKQRAPVPQKVTVETKEQGKGTDAQPAMDIGQILLSQNYIDEAELQDAQTKAKERNVALEHILREEGLVTKELLQNATAEYYKMTFVDLRSQPPDPAALELLPQSFSATFNAVAMHTEEDGTLLVATSSPERTNLLAEIQKLQPGIPKISLCYTSRESIESALGFYQKPLETRFQGIIEQHKKVAPEIIEEIFSDAIQLGASDIHFEPQEKIVIVRFRVDGVMHEAGRIPREYYEGIVNRIKIAGNMRIDEHFSAQDGAIRWRGAATGSTQARAMDVRVSIVPIVDGEKIVLRLLSEYVRTLTLSDLGFTPAQRELLIEASNKPFGMLLTTGPTGSGKSTTLYGLMKICNTPDVNISTIEDPVEYKIPGINHIQVNTKTDLTFERGLRALVRQDPDIILVGEIRDNITAQISVNAALTGHLLFSTLHANDAATAVPRLLEMGVEPYLLASTLEIVIAQRLMRRLCLHCRFSDTLSRKQACSLFQGAERHFDPGEDQVTLYRGKGCPACGGTGYRGRVGLYEILVVTPALEEMIVGRRTTAEINTAARRGGMLTLFEDGLEKVKAGLSTIDELLRVAAPPDALLPDASSSP